MPFSFVGTVVEESNFPSNQFTPDFFHAEVCKNYVIACSDVVLILSDGKILLGKRRNEPCIGQWYYFGGRMNAGETPKKTAQREVREETNLSLDISRFIPLGTTFEIRAHGGLQEGGVSYLSIIFVVYLTNDEYLQIRLNKEHGSFTAVAPQEIIAHSDEYDHLMTQVAKKVMELFPRVCS